MIDPYSTEDEIIAAEKRMIAESEEKAAQLAAKAKAGLVCLHCGANPPQPTRDGLHKCQCRMEKVKP